jgi:hypothetical protein
MDEDELEMLSEGKIIWFFIFFNWSVVDI